MKKKLRLHVDELRVESFSPGAAADAPARGTVRGNQLPTHFQPGCWTAPGEATCDAAVYTCPECASPPDTSFGCGDPEP